ncbi:hypothetical protein [Gemmatimonas groenlandica]|uniref:Uncharacterized protein n=1 Tax=Gemmatimonas groenlandica TaxID=2732249 RepID=A0A6M4IUN4_9BACT|nr:hypothetical protein [Gemmatimonas groenlandica]QJR37858.1 hypothetical protein HKW67_21190 [Gemmatimonas groenlandica]
MGIIIGVGLACAIGLLASRFGVDRDLSFYPVVAMIVASYYVLFALMGAPTEVVAVELLIGAMFLVAAAWGFARSLWLVVGALALHGLLDIGHGSIIDNPGVPAWWPAFCSTYDVTAAAYLAWRITTRRIRARRSLPEVLAIA